MSAKLDRGTLQVAVMQDRMTRFYQGYNSLTPIEKKVFGWWWGFRSPLIKDINEISRRLSVSHEHAKEMVETVVTKFAHNSRLLGEIES